MTEGFNVNYDGKKPVYTITDWEKLKDDPNLIYKSADKKGKKIIIDLNGDGHYDIKMKSTDWGKERSPKTVKGSSAEIEALIEERFIQEFSKNNASGRELKKINKELEKINKKLAKYNVTPEQIKTKYDQITKSPTAVLSPEDQLHLSGNEIRLQGQNQTDYELQNIPTDLKGNEGTLTSLQFQEEVRENIKKAIGTPMKVTNPKNPNRPVDGEIANVVADESGTPIQIDLKSKKSGHVYTYEYDKKNDVWKQKGTEKYYRVDKDGNFARDNSLPKLTPEQIKQRKEAFRIKKEKEAKLREEKEAQALKEKEEKERLEAERRAKAEEFVLGRITDRGGVPIIETFDKKGNKISRAATDLEIAEFEKEQKRKETAEKMAPIIEKLKNDKELNNLLHGREDLTVKQDNTRVYIPINELQLKEIKELQESQFDLGNETDIDIS